MRWLVWIAVILLYLGVASPAAGQTSQSVFVWPPSGRVGQLISISGRGFPASSTIGVQFTGKGRTVGTDQFGQFQANFFVPAVEPGRYDVEVFGGGSRVLSAFEVLAPSLTISPSVFQVKPGDKITLKIEGAMPFNPFQIHLGENTIASLPASPRIGADGAAIVDVVLPFFSSGDYFIKVFKGTRSEASLLINLLPESPGRIERVLSQISQQVVRVWGYDRGTGKWLLYDPTIPSDLNDLKEFKAGEAYFIWVKENCQLFSRTWHWPLYRGWNFIGWID